MILNRDIEFSSDVTMELVIKFRDEEHVETLNSFREGELLNITSEADIKMKMEKSFGINTETLSKILHQEMARKDWVNLAHWAIDIANKTSAETQKRKGEAKQTDCAKKKSGLVMSGYGKISVKHQSGRWVTMTPSHLSLMLKLELICIPCGIVCNHLCHNKPGVGRGLCRISLPSTSLCVELENKHWWRHGEEDTELSSYHCHSGWQDEYGW